jgi:hypothetical protein
LATLVDRFLDAGQPVRLACVRDVGIVEGALDRWTVEAGVPGIELVVGNTSAGEGEGIAFHAVTGEAADQILLADRFGQVAGEISLGSHLSCAPRGQIGIGHGEAVMMLRDWHDLAGDSPGEEVSPLRGVVSCGFEHRDEIFVAEFVWRTVVLGVPFHLGGVHMALVPLVNPRWHGVEGPVDEDVELCSIEPGQHAVLIAQGFPA